MAMEGSGLMCKYDEESVFFVVTAFITYAFGLCLGISAGYKQATHDFQGAAIKQGYAEYSQETGKWQWKELKKELKDE